MKHHIGGNELHKKATKPITSNIGKPILNYV